MRYSVNAFIVPQITGNQPACMILPAQSWKHLEGLALVDRDYDKPGKIDILLGVWVFVEVIRHGRWTGPHNTPTALNTDLGWVLVGSTCAQTDSMLVSTHLISVVTGVTGDDFLRRYWKVEEKMVTNCTLTVEERCALEHFNLYHSRDVEGRFVVPLPKRSMETNLGELCSQTARRFLSFERSVHSKGVFPGVQKVMQEYFDQQHAEEVPPEDLNKPQDQVFYMPMHVVCKESSTTKIHAVFDASAATSTGVSLNSTLMVGPTVHPPLINVFIRFRSHRIGMTADVS